MVIETQGPGGGSTGYLNAEQFDLDAYFDENAASALSEEGMETARADIKAQIFFSDLAKGQEQGGGSLYGIVGIALGALYGLVDGIAFDASLDAAIDVAAERREAIIEEVDGIMNFRANIENKLAQYTTPQEQMLRERTKLYGLQLRSQGLSGAQAIAAQQIAEQQYRNVVGSQMPQAITNASQEARADALARIQAVETKYGTILASERQNLLEQMQIGETKGASTGAVISGIESFSSGLGTAVDEMFANRNGENRNDFKNSGPSDIAEGSDAWSPTDNPPPPADPGTTI